MYLNDMYGQVPGLSTALETYEQSFRWGQYGVGIITGAQISSAAADAGNSPTWELRPGLVMGLQTATGQWTNYNATNSDGSQVAAGIIVEGLRMQDLNGNAIARFYALLVGGPVRGSILIGLDQNARQQMRSHFQFDDDMAGQQWYPYKTQVIKTANYQILATDNNTQFLTTGATGAVQFTLPAIAPGYNFGFMCMAAQNMEISTFEGSNMVQPYISGSGVTLTGSNITFSTASQQIGACCRVYTNPAGTKWFVELYSANTPTFS